MPFLERRRLPLNIYWLTSARKPLEIQGFRVLYVFMKMPLQHFCNK